ncbi:hypothetical protein GW17_00037135 [Ensete ventricosum]|nr:hypothetical protein GW17_00037135 [Ensete ventricosum]
MTPLLFRCSCNTLVSPSFYQVPSHLALCPDFSFAQAPPLRNSTGTEQISAVARMNSEFLRAVDLHSGHQVHWGFVGGSRIQYEPKASRIVHRRRAFRPSACCDSLNLLTFFLILDATRAYQSNIHLLKLFSTKGGALMDYYLH